jgi:hypothetical protein
MKLTESILLSLSVAFFIIGVHQTFTVGLLESYWIFMLTVGLLLIYKMKKAAQSKNRVNLDLPKTGYAKRSSSQKKRSVRK